MGTPDQTSLKETSSGNTRKQLWDFLASEAGAVMEEGVLPLAFVRGHRPKEKLRGTVASFKILVNLGGSYQTLPRSMGMKKTNPAQHFDRGREVSQPQVRKAGRALEIIAQDSDSTPDSQMVRKKEKEKTSLSGKEGAIFDQSSSSQAARVLHLDEAVSLDMPLDQPQEPETLVRTSSAKNQRGGNNREENLQMSLGQQQLVTQSKQDFSSISTIFVLLLLRLSAVNLVFFLSTLLRMVFKENQKSERQKPPDKQKTQRKKLVLPDLNQENFASNFTLPFAAGVRTQITTDLDLMTSSPQPRMHLRENEKKGSQNFEGEQKQSLSEEKAALVESVESLKCLESLKSVESLESVESVESLDSLESLESVESVDLETRIWPGEELSCKAAPGMGRGMNGKTNLYVRENLIQIVAE